MPLGLGLGIDLVSGGQVTGGQAWTPAALAPLAWYDNPAGTVAGASVTDQMGHAGDATFSADSPVWLFAPQAAVPPMTATDSATYVIIAAVTLPPLSFGRIFSTEQVEAGKGLTLLTNDTAQNLFAHFNDGALATDTPLGEAAFGSTLTTFSTVVAGQAAQGLTVRVNTTPGTAKDTTALGDRTTTVGLAVGRCAGVDSARQHLNVRAVLTFARALDAGELGLIAAYYGTA